MAIAIRIVKGSVKAVGVLALVALAALIVLLAVLWVDHWTSTELPAPSGSYKVCRVTQVWTDETRINSYAPMASTRQDLAVWIWYPPTPAPSSKRSEYLPSYWSRALERHEGFTLCSRNCPHDGGSSRIAGPQFLSRLDGRLPMSVLRRHRS